jgi:hypothetical protein
MKSYQSFLSMIAFFVLALAPFSGHALPVLLYSGVGLLLADLLIRKLVQRLGSILVLQVLCLLAWMAILYLNAVP